MNQDPMQSLVPILPLIRGRADAVDLSGDWPRIELDALAEAGVMRWSLPTAYGGNAFAPLDLYLGYETIASASLALALILSQRDSAIGLMEGALPNDAVSDRLTRLARNESFTTVGIAQLTTSRQSGPPAMAAHANADGFIIDGVIPWATGASHADDLVAGAVLPDGRQLIFLLDMSATGVSAEPPLPLVSLRASWTGQVRCDGVPIMNECVLSGPSEKVLGRRSRSLPLGQAFLTTGLCQGGLDLIANHHSLTADSARERFESQLNDLRSEMLRLSQAGHETDAAAAAPALRGQCVDLALRITHTAVALYKGTALLAGHPAQRLAREALFLLVWSCPSPVIDCTVDLLAEERG